MPEKKTKPIRPYWIKVILTVEILVIIFGLLAGGYFYLTNNTSEKSDSQTEIKETPNTSNQSGSSTSEVEKCKDDIISSKTTETKGWETYTYSVGKFRFKHPPEMFVNVSETDKSLAYLPWAEKNEMILLGYLGDIKRLNGGIESASGINGTDTRGVVSEDPLELAETYGKAVGFPEGVCEIKVGGNTGYVLVGERDSFTSVTSFLIWSNGKDSKSLIRMVVQSQTIEDDQLFNTILSTFEFID